MSRILDQLTGSRSTQKTEQSTYGSRCYGYFYCKGRRGRIFATIMRGVLKICELIITGHIVYSEGLP